MNLREKHDEVFWRDLLEETDLKVGDLAKAEARLSAAEDVPLADGQAEALVRHATHVVPVLRLKKRRVQGWTKAAAVLLGSALLTAATVLVLLWIGHHSRSTMSYETQLELLARPDQPDAHRQTAMGRVASRAGVGIRALRATRDDATAPIALSDGARLGIARLLTLLAVEPPQRPRAFCSDLDDAITRLHDTGLALDVRALELERLVLGVGSDIGELRCAVAKSSDLRDLRSLLLRRIQAELTNQN